MPKKHRPKTEGASNPPKDEAEGREDAPELVDLEDGTNVEAEVTIDEPEIAITNESQKVSEFGREQKLKFAKMNLFNRKFEFKPLPPAV